MFASILAPRDAARAEAVVRALTREPFPLALVGSLAVDARLIAHGRAPAHSRLNDIDIVVAGFAALPASLADRFVVHHVHPDAAQGKILLQLIDAERAVRIDIFRAFGNTHARSGATTDTEGLRVAALEDLRASVTRHICLTLGRGEALSPKHAKTFQVLSGLGSPDALNIAWRDHGGLQMDFDDATRAAARLRERHADLLVEEHYSTTITACDRCQPTAAFQPSPPELIVRTLGYW